MPTLHPSAGTREDLLSSGPKLGGKMDDRTVTTISAGGTDTRRTDLPHCTVVMCLSRWPAGAPVGRDGWRGRPGGPGQLAGSDHEEAARETLSDDGSPSARPSGPKESVFSPPSDGQAERASLPCHRPIEWATDSPS